MFLAEQAKERLRKTRRKLLLSLAINGLVPLILYALLHQLVANDAAALAIAGTIPAARTVLLWLWRRRVDWIGTLAVLSFAVALAISCLSGGSTLALELRGSVLTGMIGLVCLISLVIRKPLLVALIRVFAPNIPGLPPTTHNEGNNLPTHQRLITLTTVIGFALSGKTVIDIVLALALPTATFLAVSRVVNWTILGGGLAFVWLTRRPIGGQTGNDR